MQKTIWQRTSGHLLLLVLSGRLDALRHIVASHRSGLGCNWDYDYFQRCNPIAVMNSRTAFSLFLILGGIKKASHYDCLYSHV